MADFIPQLQAFRLRLGAASEQFAFTDTLAAIEVDFDYAPKKFVNGGLESAAGINAGSAKVFSMGKLIGLSEEEVLGCFAEHYRQVLGDPDGTSHGNIRAFMKHGWSGVEFPDGLAVTLNEKTLPEMAAFRKRLGEQSSSHVFSETLDFISAHFDYCEKPFVNGGVESAAGSNAGSCKVLSLAVMSGLSKDEVLAAFGEHYRQVLGDPDGTSHGNIRALMKHGLAGIQLPQGSALTPKNSASAQAAALGLLKSIEIMFAETMEVMSHNFDYTPKRFVNGGLSSEAKTNEGSCKAFSLAKILGLSKEEVLASFGEHYRQVLGDPDGTSHGNIRALMKHGVDGASFPDGLCLSVKTTASPAIQHFKQRLVDSEKEPQLVFSETLDFITRNCEYTPRRFVNGGLESSAEANVGSCKALSLGIIAGLTEGELLKSFGEHYRQVLGDADGTSHGNIRAFMKNGWSGVQFPDGLGLTHTFVSNKRRRIKD